MAVFTRQQGRDLRDLYPDITLSDIYHYRTMRRAGYSAAEAMHVVKAQRIAWKLGLSVVWDIDPDECVHCECGSDECACYARKPHTVEMVHIEDADGNLTYHSLGGVCEADGAYRRYVAADLILEAAAEIEQRALLPMISA